MTYDKYGKYGKTHALASIGNLVLHFKFSILQSLLHCFHQQPSTDHMILIIFVDINI